MSDLKEKDEKEIKSFGCDMCKISYSSEKDLKEHFWSLIHHTKIEDQKRNSIHHCTLCLCTCKTIPEYKKHLLDTRHKSALEKFNLAEENGESYVYSEKEDDQDLYSDQYREDSNNVPQWWGKGAGPHPNASTFWNVPPWQRRSLNNYHWQSKDMNNRFNEDQCRNSGPWRSGDKQYRNNNKFKNIERREKHGDWKFHHDKETSGRERNKTVIRSNKGKKGNSKDKGFENPFWHSNEDWQPPYPEALMMMSMQGDQPWQNNDPYFDCPGYGGPHRYGYRKGYHWKSSFPNQPMPNYMNYGYGNDSPEDFERGQGEPADFCNIESPKGIYTDFDGSQEQQRPFDEESEEDYNITPTVKSKEKLKSGRKCKRLLNAEDKISKSISKKRLKLNNDALNSVNSVLPSSSKNIKKHTKVKLIPKKLTSPSKRMVPNLPTKKGNVTSQTKTFSKFASRNRIEPTLKSISKPCKQSSIVTRASKTKALLNISKSNNTNFTDKKADISSVPGSPDTNMKNAVDSQPITSNPISCPAPIPMHSSKETPALKKRYLANPKVTTCTNISKLVDNPTNKPVIQKGLLEKLKNTSVTYKVDSRPKKARKNVRQRESSKRTKTSSSLSVVSEALVTSSSSIAKDQNDDDISRSSTSVNWNSHDNRNTKSIMRQYSGEPSTTSDVIPGGTKDLLPIPSSPKIPQSLHTPVIFSSKHSHFIHSSPKVTQTTNTHSTPDTSRTRHISEEVNKDRRNLLMKPGNKALTNETLVKLVNSPRSRKDRMQLANMLRNHAKSQHRLDSSRICSDDLDTAQVNHDLVGLCETLVGSERDVPSIKIEDLTPEIQLHIAQLIEDDSELGTFEQSLLAAINEKRDYKDISTQNMEKTMNDRTQEEVASISSPQAVVKTEPTLNKVESSTNTSGSKILHPVVISESPQPNQTITIDQSPVRIQQQTLLSSKIIPETPQSRLNVSSSAVPSTSRPNYVPHPFYPGPYPFPSYPPPGFHPFHPMQFLNQANMFNPSVNPAFNMYPSVRNQLPASESTSSVSSFNTNSSQQISHTPNTTSFNQAMNSYVPFHMGSSVRTPFRAEQVSTTSMNRSVSTSPMKLTNKADDQGEDYDAANFSNPNQEEKSVLRAVLSLMLQEEDLQSQLSIIDVKAVNLQKVFRKTIRQLTECQMRRAQLSDKQTKLREKKKQLVKGCLLDNVNLTKIKPFPCDVDDTVSITVAEISPKKIPETENIITSPNSHISLSSSNSDTLISASIISTNVSLDISTSSIESDYQIMTPVVSKVVTLKPQTTVSRKPSLFLSSPQTDSQTSVMADSTDSSCSIDEVIVESDCTTEDEATDYIKLMEKSNGDNVINPDVIKSESVCESSSQVVEIFESPNSDSDQVAVVSLDSSCELTPFEKMQKTSSPNINAGDDSVHDKSVFSPSRTLFLPDHPTDLITSQADIISLEQSIFVSPGKNQTCTFSPAKNVHYLRQRSVSESDAEMRKSGNTSPNICGRPVKYLGAISGSSGSASILKQLAANFAGVTSVSCLPINQVQGETELSTSGINDEQTVVWQTESSETRCENEKPDTLPASELRDCSIILEKLEMDLKCVKAKFVCETNEPSSEIEPNSEPDNQTSLVKVNNTDTRQEKHEKLRNIIESSSEGTIEEENLPFTDFKLKLLSQQSNISQYSGISHQSLTTVEFSDSDSEDSDLLEIGSGYEAYLQSVEDVGNQSIFNNDNLVFKFKSHKVFNGPKLTVSGIDFDRDNVYVCYKGYGVKRFSIETGELNKEYEIDGNTINCMTLGSLSTGETRLYLAGIAFSVRAYDVENSSPLCVVDVMEEVKCLHSDYGHVYGGLVNGMLEVIILQTNKKIDTYQSDDQCIHCITSAREGGFKLLCVSSQDATITIYDAFSGLPVRVLEGHNKTAFSVKVNISKVYSGSGDKTVMVHDLHTGELEYIYKDHKGMVSNICIEGNLLFTASYDRLIRCYDTENQTLKCMYYGAGQRVVSMLAIYDGKLYTGNRDGEISVIPLHHQHVWPCQCDNCQHVFAVREHLLHHVSTDHIEANSFMSKCTWRGCKQWFSTQRDTKKFESHMMSHLELVDV